MAQKGREGVLAPKRWAGSSPLKCGCIKALKVAYMPLHTERQTGRHTYTHIRSTISIKRPDDG